MAENQLYLCDNVLTDTNDNAAEDDCCCDVYPLCNICSTSDEVLVVEIPDDGIKSGAAEDCPECLWFNGQSFELTMGSACSWFGAWEAPDTCDVGFTNYRPAIDITVSLTQVSPGVHKLTLDVVVKVNGSETAHGIWEYQFNGQLDCASMCVYPSNTFLDNEGLGVILCHIDNEDGAWIVKGSNQCGTEAKATSAAQDAAVGVRVDSSQASATATAYDSVVATMATQAEATATSQDASIGVTVDSSQAPATSSAADATAGVTVDAGQASATASGVDASVGQTAPGLQASGTSTATDSSVDVTVNTSAATASATAQTAAVTTKLNCTHCGGDAPATIRMTLPEGILVNSNSSNCGDFDGEWTLAKSSTDGCIYSTTSSWDGNSVELKVIIKASTVEATMAFTSSCDAPEEDGYIYKWIGNHSGITCDDFCIVAPYDSRSNHGSWTDCDSNPGTEDHVCTVDTSLAVFIESGTSCDILQGKQATATASAFNASVAVEECMCAGDPVDAWRVFPSPISWGGNACFGSDCAVSLAKKHELTGGSYCVRTGSATVQVCDEPVTIKVLPVEVDANNYKIRLIWTFDNSGNTSIYESVETRPKSEACCTQQEFHAIQVSEDAGIECEFPNAINIRAFCYEVTVEGIAAEATASAQGATVGVTLGADQAQATATAQEAAVTLGGCAANECVYRCLSGVWTLETDNCEPGCDCSGTGGFPTCDGGREGQTETSICVPE